MGEGYLRWTWKPRVEVGYRLKIGTEDDSSLRAHLASAYHSTTICTRLTYLQQSTSQFRTIRCHAASQLDRRTSMAPHGALPVQGPGCGQPRNPWNKPRRRLPCLGIPPATLRGQGTLLHRPVLPQSTRTTTLAWNYLYGASDRGQLTSNAVHPWTPRRRPGQSELWATVGGVLRHPHVKASLVVPGVGRG